MVVALGWTPELAGRDRRDLDQRATRALLTKPALCLSRRMARLGLIASFLLRPGSRLCLMKRFLLVLLAPLLGACSTLITPETIRLSGAPEESRGQALDLLEEAVIQANEFLISEHRLSLPPARYERAENGTLEFVTESRRWPVRIRHSFGGDLVVITGFRAQERDDGFVVGSRPPDEHPEIDNSMFRDRDGDWHSAESIARLILHETAHTVHGVGTVGYWSTVCYYAEAIFLLRSSNHSAER